MKTLLLALLLNLEALAAGRNGPREVLSDQEINQKLISVARDVENEKILSGVSDLQDCKKQFTPPRGQDNTAALSQLQNCIKGKFSGKSEDDIKAISDRLSLETHKLIPSKTVNNVTEYLSKKLYKNLTGVDLGETLEQRILKSKFGNKKLLDQKEFFDLYKNQVAKNVIFEISRFCLIDFRKDNAPSNDSFMAHWNDLNDFSTPTPPTISVKDDGSLTPFGASPTASAAGSGTNPASNQGSYSEIFKDILGPSTVSPDPVKLDRFFSFCGTEINNLCKAFEAGKNGAPAGRVTAPSTSQSAPGSVTPPTSVSTIGSKACIAKYRLIAYKAAFSASDEIYEEFIKNNGANASLPLDRAGMVKRYQGGSGAGEKSLKEITNAASFDFYEGTKNQDDSDSEDCVNNGDQNACDKFVVVDDSRENIQNNTDLVYIARKEAERQRIAALKAAGDQALLEYLEKNYPDLKSEYEKNNSFDLETAVASRWEARRQAMQKEIVDRLGKRQITEAEAQQTVAGGVTKKQQFAKENAQEAMKEKSRLAQAVFFNNIIASSLELKTTDGKSLGRNIGAINTEIEAGRNAVQTDLFDNLQGTLGKNSSGTGVPSGNQNITNIDFLNPFIGVPQAKPGQGNSGGNPGQ